MEMSGDGRGWLIDKEQQSQQRQHVHKDLEVVKSYSVHELIED